MTPAIASSTSTCWAPEPSASCTRPPASSRLLRAAVGGTAKVDGWALLSAVGSYLSARNPGFDVRDYGFPELGHMVRAQDYVEVREVPGPAGLGQLHVRTPRSARGAGRRPAPDRI